MLTKATRSLVIKFFAFLSKLNFTPFEPDPENHEYLRVTPKKRKLFIWYICAFLIWIKTAFVLGRYYFFGKTIRLNLQPTYFIWIFAYSWVALNYMNFASKKHAIVWLYNQVIKINYQLRDTFPELYEENPKKPKSLIIVIKLFIFYWLELPTFITLVFISGPNKKQFYFSLLPEEYQNSPIVFGLFILFQFLMFCLFTSGFVPNFIIHLTYNMTCSDWLSKFREKILHDKEFGMVFNPETDKILKAIRKLQILNIHYNIHSANHYYPHIKCVLSGLTVFMNVVLIRYFSILDIFSKIIFTIGVIMAYIVLVMLIMSTGAMLVNTRKIVLEFNKPKMAQRQCLLFKKTVKSYKEFGVKIGQFYFIKYTTLFTLVYEILNFTVTVLIITYRKES